ncbi:helix-turn-helix domain-containing protein [Virgibacillus xinjiangensis]|uniref:Helix-turn-helix domain-containing protein n=1 Tax=Virgibacillus xinjiangensis TaxID=393090 RepID=A0ABV7CX72_9BACI
MKPDWGKRLEELRTERGWDKKEVSAMLGFTQNVYGQYERQYRTPPLETLMRIADLYGSSLDYIAYGEEKRRRRPVDDLEKLRELLLHFEDEGIEQPFILDLDRWYELEKEDLEELRQRFEEIYQKAVSEKGK